MARRSEGTALHELKSLILERGLRPGEPMPTENELVDLLDVSRTSVREAVRTLAAQDILEVRHGTGTFVGGFSLRPLVDQMVFQNVLLSRDDMSMVREVVEMRVALDLAMAEPVTVALPALEAEIASLAALVDEMVAKAEKGKTFEVEDRAFHEGLAACAGNKLMTDMVGALWEIHSLTMPKLGLPTTDDVLDTANAHRKILECAVSGDRTTYAEAVRGHYAPLFDVLANIEGRDE